MPGLMPGIDASNQARLHEKRRVIVSDITTGVILDYLPKSLSFLEKILDDDPPYSFRIFQLDVNHLRSVSGDEVFRPRGVRAPYLIVISSLLTAVVLVISAIQKDGIGIITTIALSCLKPSNFRDQPTIVFSDSTSSSTRQTTVIRTRNGSFYVVYHSLQLSEIPRLKSDALWNRMLEGAITLIHFVSLILLSNMKPLTQFVFGLVFIVVTILHHVWPHNLPYSPEIEIKEIFRPATKDAHLRKPDLRETESSPQYVRTAWYVLQETRNADWMVWSRVFPHNKIWEWWLEEAVKNIENEEWPAVAEFRRIVGVTDVYKFPTYHEGDNQPRNSPKPSLEMTPVPVERW